MRPRAQTNAAAMRILVIDDEPDMLNNYIRLLEGVGYVCAALDGPERLVGTLREFQPNLVLTDMVMPGGTGFDVMELAHQYDPAMPVIILTAHGTIEAAVEAIKRRAADYMTKPFSVEELLGKIQQLVSRRLMEAPRDDTAGASARDPQWRRAVVGVSPQIERALELALKVARTDVNVLILGESGTGKEVFARLIHRMSSRAREVFVPVDCNSLPENLIESELFGYQKGAFTGATSSRVGLLQFAQRGTLFLDEIGDMPLSLQTKLLRVLQERQFRPIGGREQVDVDMRVLAATNRDLEQAVLDKTFRSDLFYRLNVVTLRLPPLREHIEDLPLLSDHFLRLFAEMNNRLRLQLHPATMELMKQHHWPGNIRELRNCIDYAATMAEDAVIRPEDLPETFGVKEVLPSGDRSAHLFPTKNELVLNFERDYLIALLVEHDFNFSKAAGAAGCHRRTLYRMVHRQNLDLAALRREQGKM